MVIFGCRNEKEIEWELATIVLSNEETQIWNVNACMHVGAAFLRNSVHES